MYNKITGAKRNELVVHTSKGPAPDDADDGYLGVEDFVFIAAKKIFLPHNEHNFFHERDIRMRMAMMTTEKPSRAECARDLFKMFYPKSFDSLKADPKELGPVLYEVVSVLDDIDIRGDRREVFNILMRIIDSKLSEREG